MAKIFGLICFIVFLASTAFGQAAGTIYLVSDPATYNCSIQDTEPGIVQIHMIVDLPNGWAVHFGAPKPECWTGATYLGEYIDAFIPLGNSQADLGLILTIATVTKGNCPERAAQSPKYVGYISYMTSGQAPSCCEYPVTKAHDSLEEFPGPVGTVCADPIDPNHSYNAFKVVLMRGVSAIINSDSSCPCLSTTAYSEDPNPNYTWGAIKSLYDK